MSDRKKLLTEIIERQSGKRVAHLLTKPRFTQEAIAYYEFVFGGQEGAQDLEHIINSLPEVIHDTMGLADVVDGLVGIIVQQQLQINELSNRMEELTRASIGLRAQENVHDILMKLTAQGSNVSKPEVTIKLSANTSYRRAETSELQSGHSLTESQTRAGEVAVGVQALIKALMGMKFAYETENSKAYQEYQKLNEQVSLSQDKSYQGDVVIKFESITGNPLIQARAEAIRRGLKLSEKELEENDV